MRRALLVGALCLTALAAQAQSSFVAFESGPVRPVALSPSGDRLFVVNIPDNQLEVFDVQPDGSLVHAATVPVGMEPVAVAARTDSEVWVVNHLSDSVSIVDLAANPPRVKRTLLVGDEPRDIVFAGSSGNRAFITTAHRGQHRTDVSISGVTGAGDPALTTPGVGRADVWVFDGTSPATLGSTFGGTPLEILTFFADTPRALATDGATVYVAAFHSGNQTTTVLEICVPNGFDSAGPQSAPGPCPESGTVPGGVPGPDRNENGVGGTAGEDDAPETGLIVKFHQASGEWRDVNGRDWSDVIPFDLPDRDVFAVDADTLAKDPVSFDHVGTILFNMAVNPVSGKLYVTNTESPNDVRFEGPGDFGGTTVQGHLSEARVSVLDPLTKAVDPQHLNHHIDYGQLHTDSGANHAAINGQIPHSLATPLQPVVSSDGSTLYLAAFGSAKIGVFDTTDLEDPLFDDELTPSYDPTVESTNYIATTGGGPAGLALLELGGADRLYVLTRFDNALQVIDPGTGTTVESHALHNPEPQDLIDGRPILYDAVATSGNGEASCSSCHIFGDFDSLAWNLGNPDDVTSVNSQPSSTPFFEGQSPPLDEPNFHPMKGPMTTQTLRGMATHGGLHWRGDRVDGIFSAGGTSCGGSGFSNAPCDEETSFRNFIVAFEGLVGKEGTISNAQMQQFADFILQVFLPPNPVAELDNSLTAPQQAGKDKYFSCGPGTTECSFPSFDPDATDTVEDCDGCHDLDPVSGFFGSGGEKSFENEPQNAKVPHLRNVYAKIGMFSQAGDQVRGTGFLHDGSVDTLKSFVAAGVFALTPSEEDQLEQFMLAFPSDLAPIVGQQVTLTDSSHVGMNARITLMNARAATSFDSFMLGGTVTECDVIAKGSVGNQARGWVREAGGQYRDDTNVLWSDAAVRALADSDGPVTYTCAPPGSGTRMGINRDGDSHLDGLDNCPGLVNESQANFDGDARGDDCDADDDNDGLLDVVETNTGTFNGPDDTGTDPFNADTDGDGVDDGVEVAHGTDPTDAGSVPVIPALPLWGAGLLGAALLGGGWRAGRQRRAQRTTST